MLFNSFEFAVFLPLIFVLYWLVFRRKLWLQNLLILVASYVFYGWWDWRFLSLIFLSSVSDYFLGMKLAETEQKRTRKILLIVSLVINLSILGFFKYYNFFAQSLVDAFNSLGIQMNYSSLRIILPVGISFYTFQTLSYTIDIYKKKLEPTKDFIQFFAFVSFFPQLVAGPIERAKNLLPQFSVERKFDISMAKDGLRQILWGLFKKIVVADSCAIFVDEIFNNYEFYPGQILVLGVIGFAFQIYCDFSGYSDIAIGTAKLFGFNLMTNFAMPYFSRDIGEFWRRWHISLSTWFRDYVYIPLGGSRCSKSRQILNSIITFTVSGFWHGANWTFVAWGFLNGLYYVPSIIRNKTKDNQIVAFSRRLPTMAELFKMALTFTMVLLAWTFFRADSITHAISYLKHLFTAHYQSYPELKAGSLLFILLLLFIEWIQRRKNHPFDLSGLKTGYRWTIYIATIFVIVIFGQFDYKEFIYFQF